MAQGDFEMYTGHNSEIEDDIGCQKDCTTLGEEDI
jgi:hypothetical protein